MRCCLISWAQSNDGGCTGVLPLLDVTERSLSVTFHCSFTKTPEQLVGASEKPINSNVPATCLVMPVPILPQQLQKDENEVMNDGGISRLKNLR
jgi:hypothetical protein